jgi:cobyrinic acid a,c-diamide synthase
MGFHVQPFKIGPDFIDPGLHSQITGLNSRNLDGWMLSESYNRHLFQRIASHADIAVVEGVMGLFDGYDGLSESGSSAQMAKWLGLPVVLVVDARSMARSAAALVYGFTRFDPDLNVIGVIFNRVGGPGHLEYLKEAMSANLPEISVLGGIPREEKIRIPERHLGLMTSDELHLDDEWRKAVTHIMVKYIDLDLIRDRARWTGRSLHASASFYHDGVAATSSTPIAVARDAAFCFYYSDNLEYLERAGAELHFFSPLEGESFPEDCLGLFLGGGYPEVHAQALSSIGEKGFFRDVRRASLKGMPIYAECGGLMALSQFIESTDGERFPMAGVLPFGTRMLKRRKALGYTQVRLTQTCPLGETGLIMRGHEFHYSEIVETDEYKMTPRAYEIQSRKNQSTRLEGYLIGSVLASYVHLHWGSAPHSAAHWVAKCSEFGRKNNIGQKH